MTALALSQFAVLVILYLGVFISQKRRLPQVAPGLALAARASLGELIRPSLFFGLIVLAQALILQGPVLLTSAFLGGAAVALLVTTRTLVNLIHQIVTTFNSALWPEITSLEARGEQDKLRTALRLLQALFLGLGAGLVAFLWYEGTGIIRVWTGGRLEADPTLLRLFLVFLMLRCLWTPSSLLPAAVNRHESLAWAYFLAALLGLGAMVLLFKPLGLWAVPLGLLAGEALACYHFVVRNTCRMLAVPYIPYARRLWLAGATAVGSALLVGWAAHLVAAGTLAASLAATWLIWLCQADRDWIFSKLSCFHSLVSRKS
jgi:O-antigen/teichoic acid export membrane protein